MEIIKKGKLPEEPTVEGTCSNCGCVVRCKAGEDKRESSQREDDYFTVRCPTFGCKATINCYQET